MRFALATVSLFLVTWVVVSVNEIDWIAAASGFGVATCKERIQPLARYVHLAWVLAILATHLQCPREVDEGVVCA